MWYLIGDTVQTFVARKSGSLLVSKQIINNIDEKLVNNQLIGHSLLKSNKAVFILFSCAVNGMWGSWTSWTACSRTCGYGTRQRMRFCDNPKPAFNGTYCIGVGNQTEKCNASHPCPSTLFSISVTIGRFVRYLIDWQQNETLLVSSY